MIARVLCATAQSEQAAETMAELWGEQAGRFERTAPGFQGAVPLREGAKLLAVSCREGEGVAEGVLIELPEREQPPSPADAYAELAADAAALDAAAFRARYRLP